MVPPTSSVTLQTIGIRELSQREYNYQPNQAIKANQSKPGTTNDYYVVLDLGGFMSTFVPLTYPIEYSTQSTIKAFTGATGDTLNHTSKTEGGGGLDGPQGR
ncbi:hypothetical protein G9A89_000441 [Geosiphon pyriformis]|nr:hypothetical protein G9A89_000441 [Geosiphon pyriformis]